MPFFTVQLKQEAALVEELSEGPPGRTVSFMIDAEAGRLFPEFGEYQQIQDFEAGEGPKLCIFAF